jgi:hypothetical protein
MKAASKTGGDHDETLRNKGMAQALANCRYGAGNETNGTRREDRNLPRPGYVASGRRNQGPTKIRERMLARLDRRLFLVAPGRTIEEESMNGGSTMATREHVFTRTLGSAPQRGKPKSWTAEQFGWFTEIFGPPEIKTLKHKKTIFWNFVRDDGTKGFSLISDVSWMRKKYLNHSLGLYEIEVYLVAGRGLQSFREWTAIRFDAVMRGIEKPAFPGFDPRFVIRRVN